MDDGRRAMIAQFARFVIIKANEKRPIRLAATPAERYRRRRSAMQISDLPPLAAPVVEPSRTC